MKNEPACDTYMSFEKSVSGPRNNMVTHCSLFYPGLSSSTKLSFQIQFRCNITFILMLESCQKVMQWFFPTFFPRKVFFFSIWNKMWGRHLENASLNFKTWFLRFLPVFLFGCLAKAYSIIKNFLRISLYPFPLLKKKVYFCSLFCIISCWDQNFRKLKRIILFTCFMLITTFSIHT